MGEIDELRALLRKTEQQRDHWEDTCHHAERQRDDWARLCHEAEDQRDEWQRLCHQAEGQRDDLLRELERLSEGWSPLQYGLPFSGIERCTDERAHLASRERVFLYGLVFSLGPRRVLEVGTYRGGSARIISAALDDLHQQGELLTIDPFPEQIDVDWSEIAHNAISVKGYFPRDFERSRRLRELRFDLAFVDGDHSYRGVLEDLRYLPRILEPDAYVLLHDAYNAEVGRAIEEAVRECGYHDCGVVGRVRNDSCGDELFGGLRLLWRR